MTKQNIILDYLKQLFPSASCELNFLTDFQLLVAVILSAQCTDKRVNMVTPILFEKYPDANAMKDAKQEDVENIIRSCGFYREKAKHIISASKDICEKFGGKLPRDRDEMQTLAGVGRKTANVVCSNVYNDNVIAVDTHVLRVSNRLGLANTKNPNICEKNLENLFKKQLKDLHHRFVLFGRYYCTARNPKCESCKLKDICIYYKKNIKG